MTARGDRLCRYEHCDKYNLSKPHGDMPRYCSKACRKAARAIAEQEEPSTSRLTSENVLPGFKAGLLTMLHRTTSHTRALWICDCYGLLETEISHVLSGEALACRDHRKWVSA